MNDKYFLDTNVLIYAVGNDLPKKEIAVGLITDRAVISTQVISEMTNVMHRKLRYEYAEIRIVINRLLEEMECRIIAVHTIQTALNIAERYRYSCFDSQILACALEHECAILYSEDLQHGQVIENELGIINPFLS